jgi:hypothetical protein
MEIVNYIFLKRFGHGQVMGTPSRIFLKLRKEFFHSEINMEKKFNWHCLVKHFFEHSNHVLYRPNWHFHFFSNFTNPAYGPNMIVKELLIQDVYIK